MATPQFTRGSSASRAAKIVYEDRKAFLLELGFKSYRSYLASALWKSIKARLLLPGMKCEYCEKPAVTLHHSSYWPSVLRGESTKPLHPVCNGCHLFGEFDRTGKKVSPIVATRNMKSKRVRSGHAAQVVDANTWNARSGALPPDSILMIMPWWKRAACHASHRGLWNEYNRIMRSGKPKAERKAALVALLGERAVSGRPSSPGRNRPADEEKAGYSRIPLYTLFMSKTTLTLPTGSHNYSSTSPVAAPVPTERTSSLYALPSGQIVPIADDVARGAGVVSYQLADGTIVNAIRATRPVYAADDPRAFDFVAAGADQMDESAIRQNMAIRTYSRRFATGRR